MEYTQCGTPEFENRFNKSVATWSRAYRLTLKRYSAKQKRLDELLTWDVPINKNDEGAMWEHTAKVTALQNLLNTTK